MSETLGRILGHARKYSFRKAERSFRSCPSSVVTIHNLKSSRDDGILYPDDQLNDVADDREQIIAVFEESYSPLPQYTCGDVTSTSSVCTGSPDLFSVEVGSLCGTNGNCEASEETHGLTVAPLQVRRGSEPALNCLFPSPTPPDPSKRWSTAVVINQTGNGPSVEDDGVHENGMEECASPMESLEMNGDSKMSSLNFSRGSGRLSILGNNCETYRWVEAADRQLMKDFNENFTLKTTSAEDATSDVSSLSDERERTIILKNETGPLGIHVVPDSDCNGRDNGLVIQGIEAGGRIDRDGRFHVGDRITEINGLSLQNVSFQRAQEIFKSALKSPQIRLELVRGSGYLQGRKAIAAVPRKPPAPIYPKTEGTSGKSEEEALVEGEERAGGIATKVATVTPTKKVPASATRRLASANTRRMGKKVHIELVKGPSGLGFSITTRDNPAGGNPPIYIKNILPKGAAIDDGRLLPGDRLLEVNGVPITGKNHTDVVSILRTIPNGSSVKLIVSRQDVEEEVSEPDPEVNSAAMAPKDDEVGIFPWKEREILTFQIPLPDPQSGGLGLSVKGKSTDTDLGIFIKGLIPGGAAAKDGRLQPEDQLVNINGISLLGMSNSNAMETLRHAMTQPDGPIRNVIILTIARRIDPPPDKQPDTNGRLDDATSSNIVRNGFVSKHKDVDGVAMNHPCMPGTNPVIERLTGQIGVAEKTGNYDVYGYSRFDKSSKSSIDENRNPTYSSGLSSKQTETVLIEGEYDPTSRKSTDSLLTNGTSSETASILPAGSQLSLDEANPGFARDGFGRQSMSEKRHAQLDARNTDTYQRNKKAREERGRQSSENSPEDANKKPSSVQGRKEVGPSLGLRKSSSLESLQTMLQELQKDDQEASRRTLHSGNSTRGSRNRGCNESFRAAVDRSYDAPASNAMETLDEESETGSHILTRSVELGDSHPLHLDPFQEDLLGIKHPKKKSSLLKGLGSVFRFGKNRKQSQDLRSKDDDSQDSDSYHHHHHHTTKEHERLSEPGHPDLARRQLPQIPHETVSASSLESAPNRQERMRSLREQHQRMHQRRQGQYPLEQKEEFYENELKEKESNYALPCDIVHGRSHSFDIYKENTHNPKTTFSGDPNRYSHYMNYKEIQQHIHQRFPTVHGAHLQPADQNPSNYSIDYHLPKRHQGSEVGSNSLPRGSHTSDLASVTGQATGKTYFGQEVHVNYGRMNVPHFYPANNKLYSHMVPGSKV